MLLYIYYAISAYSRFMPSHHE